MAIQQMYSEIFHLPSNETTKTTATTLGDGGRSDQNVMASSSCLQPISAKENHLGLGRYAYERWVWSHPDVIPADVIPMGKINVTEFPPTWTPSFRRSLMGSPKRMGLHRGIGESSFARLEGRLYEWDYLYHKAPSNDSWIWDYYKGYETGTAAFKIKHCAR